MVTLHFGLGKRISIYVHILLFLMLYLKLHLNICTVTIVNEYYDLNMTNTNRGNICL